MAGFSLTISGLENKNPINGGISMKPVTKNKQEWRSHVRIINIGIVNFVSRLIGVIFFFFGIIFLVHQANPTSISTLIWPISGKNLDLFAENFGLMLVPSIMLAVWSRSILISIFKVDDEA
jgi:hypothetical protein